MKAPLTLLLAGLLGLTLSASAAEPECFPDDVLPDNMFPTVLLKTSMGDVVVELNRRRAPVTANNFLRYVLAGAYDGTIFHLGDNDYRVCSQERQIDWFLASAEADYIVAQTYNVDGGNWMS